MQSTTKKVFNLVEFLYLTQSFVSPQKLIQAYYLIFVALTVSKLVINKRKKRLVIPYLKALRLGKSPPIVWNELRKH